MPRSRNRSALKNGTNASIVASKTAEKIGEVYRNWLAGRASQRIALKQLFDHRKEKHIHEINQLIFNLSPDIANMTVEDFLKARGIQQEQDKDHPTEEEQVLQERPMETDPIVSTVEHALVDLEKQVSKVETTTRSTRRKAKKAPPKPTRKRKKPSKLVTETPLTSVPAPVTWEDTPFMSLTRPRTRGERSEPESRAGLLTEAEARDASLKLVCMTADGSKRCMRR